jgi:hypothetical protein
VSSEKLETLARVSKSGRSALYGRGVWCLKRKVTPHALFLKPVVQKAGKPMILSPLSGAAGQGQKRGDEPSRLNPWQPQ